MTTMEKLPGEVLSDILIRLLAKELAQMRSVCKPWNALLSESSFVKSHLNRSIQNNDDILLFCGKVFSFERSPFTARASHSPDLELTNFIKLPVIPERKNGCGIVIGSVNGLVCFRYGSCHKDYDVHIWNPSLSALLTLPPCPVNFQLFEFGFGYDPKSDDYKVVKLERFSRAPSIAPQALVYSLRKGSWESISTQTFPSHLIISQTFPSHMIISQDIQVCVDDKLHWLCKNDLDRKRETILAFDLGAETFCEMPLPDSCLHHHRFCLNVLGVLVGKLCVMEAVEDGICDVWVMEEYGVSESWVKHHAFSQFSGGIDPYGFTSHGEFLFQINVHVGRFGLYDPVAAKTKTFKIRSRSSFEMKFVEYVDSLVWVPPPKHEISSCDISQLQIGK